MPPAVEVFFPAPAERTPSRTRRTRTALALAIVALVCAISPLAVFRPAPRAAPTERTRTRRTRTALALAAVIIVCAMFPLAAFFPAPRAAPAERTRTRRMRTALALACAMSPLAAFFPARRAAPAERTRRMRTALALVAVALACAMSPLAACGGVGASATGFSGTSLSDGGPAPDFVLTDQFGESVSLADMRGRAVALSFLFTGCPDVCPVVTTQLKRLYDELGADADSVEFVTVSVDPERDDPQAAMRYLERWGVANEWRYLTGAPRRPRADMGGVLHIPGDRRRGRRNPNLVAPRRRHRSRSQAVIRRRDRHPALRDSRAALVLDTPLRPRLPNRPRWDAPPSLHPPARRGANGVGY